jgi:hypothetical protein
MTEQDPSWLRRLVAAWGEPNLQPPTSLDRTPASPGRRVKHDGMLWFHIGQRPRDFLRRGWVWFPGGQNHGLHIDYRGHPWGDEGPADCRYTVNVWGWQGSLPTRVTWEGVAKGGLDDVITASVNSLFGFARVPPLLGRSHVIDTELVEEKKELG